MASVCMGIDRLIEGENPIELPYLMNQHPANGDEWHKFHT